MAGRRPPESGSISSHCYRANSPWKFRLRGSVIDLTSGSGCHTAGRRSLPGCVRSDPITRRKAVHRPHRTPSGAARWCRVARRGCGGSGDDWWRLVWWSWDQRMVARWVPGRMRTTRHAPIVPCRRRVIQAGGWDGATDSSHMVRPGGRFLIFRRSGRGIPAAGRESSWTGRRWRPVALATRDPRRLRAGWRSPSRRTACCRCRRGPGLANPSPPAWR